MLLLILTEVTWDRATRLRLALRVSTIALALTATRYFAYLSRFSVPEWLRFEALSFQQQAQTLAPHPYASSPVAWLYNQKPIWYFFETSPYPHGMIGMGNPMLWWLFLPALTWVFYRLINERSATHKLIIVWFATTFLPLLVVATVRTGSLYLYHLMPTLPALVLAVTVLLSDVIGKIRWVYFLYGAITVLTTLFFVPILWGSPLTLEYVAVLSHLLPFK